MKVESKIKFEGISQADKILSAVTKIEFRYPAKIVFGKESFDQFFTDFIASGLKNLFILSISPLEKSIIEKATVLKENGIKVEINCEIKDEPSFEDFNLILKKAKDFKADSIVGIGGGSVMDTAKLLASMINNEQGLDQIVGIGLLKKRTTYLACMPTTSGTGSEVSPNAIFSDKEGKKGVISPYLVPDAAYIDPELTLGVPPAVTASTGLDALTHCIEAFVNRFSHPMCDLIALEGIRLIGANLMKAYKDGNDWEARSNMALGSVYGGMCLGPVNTGAVHALSYPLGSKFKIPHGLANALLLPYVLEYNLPAAVEKYASVALALGADKMESYILTAKEGIQKIQEIIRKCSVPQKLSEIGIKKNELENMALSAIKIQRLLKNNVREVALSDAMDIYMNAY